MSTRLQTEYKNIINNPPNGITAGLVNNKITEWVATMIGPASTPYENAIFTLKINFPTNYPFAPPKIIFATPIYHCNINANGDICIDILKDAWTPALTIDKVLLSISSLLADPNPNDPLEPDIADLFKSDRVYHDSIARQYTYKYAGNR